MIIKSALGFEKTAKEPKADLIPFLMQGTADTGLFVSREKIGSKSNTAGVQNGATA